MSTTQTNEQATVERWWFTFGGGHTHPETGEDLSRAYVVLEGTLDETRTQMFASAFGNRWSHQYDSASAAGVVVYELHEVAMAAALAPAVSKIWACPEVGCGYHIADGPTADGEESTDELISQHVEEHAEVAALTAAELEAEAAPEPETARAAYTQGLREIADWLDAHPEVPLPYIDSSSSGEDRPTLGILIGWWNSKDQREDLAKVGRAMGKFSKYARPDGDRFAVSRVFGSIAVVATADRDEVCERVVVGTHEVTEEVPDPEAVAALPKVAVTKTVEDVEWRCHPLLAEPAEVAGAPAEVAV